MCLKGQSVVALYAYLTNGSVTAEVASLQNMSRADSLVCLQLECVAASTACPFASSAAGCPARLGDTSEAATQECLRKWRVAADNEDL